MPQHLPDLRQPGPGGQQVTGHGVTQPVRPDPGNPGTLARVRDDAADAIGGDARRGARTVRNTLVVAVPAGRPCSR
jgi:hypothetical protein